MRKRRYTKDELARRGREIFDRHIAAALDPDTKGKIAAIDVESGAFIVADNTLTASDQLFARNPDAQIWFIRVGFPTVHRFGRNISPRQVEKVPDTWLAYETSKQ